MTTRDLPSFKVVLLGDAKVGKSSIVSCFASRSFYPEYEATIGAYFLKKKLNINNKDVELLIWDTGGQERFLPLIPIYFRSADCCILVYDVTNQKSFEKIKTIYDEISSEFHLTTDFPILLLGNKSDCSEKKVRLSTAREFAENHKNIIFYEVSSKTCYNIEEAFEDLTKKVIDKNLGKQYIKIAEKKITPHCQRNMLKLYLLGEGGVGKTSVLNQYVYGKFTEKYYVTIGSDFSTKQIDVDGNSITLQIWDTAGKKYFQSLGPTFYDGSDCCILVYDVTNQASFEKVQNWHNQFSRELGISDYENYPFLLLGNKSDCQEKAVQESNAREYAENNNMLFYEVSSKTGDNIKESFEAIIKKALENSPIEDEKIIEKKQEINDFSLKTKCVKKLPFDIYEKNFTFIVNGKKYQTNRVIADLISPLVCQMHYSDSSNDEFFINFVNNNEDEKDYFEDFLSLCTFEETEINDVKRKYFIYYLYKLGNIDECIRLLQNTSETINEDNIFDFFQTISKMIIENNVTDPSILKLFDEMIQYVSEHFEEFDREEMSQLSNEIIDMILKNDNLTLNDEDSILEFILELYKKDHSNSNLFENVLFINVSEEKLREFVNEIKVEYINDRVFQSICQRFFGNNKPIKEKRYNKIKAIKELKVKNQDEFDGILSYLTKKTGGNIHDNGTIKITSNSIEGNNHPKNAVDYERNNIYHSKNQCDSYIVIDFKDKSIQVSGYLIQSANEDSVHLKNWVIEVSENGRNWIEIDRQTNHSKLNGFNNKKLFYIKKPHRKFYKFLRLRETGESWNQNYIGFTFIELYGKIQEPKK